MEDGHCKSSEEVINYFNVDPERGLTLDQVKRNQEKYGPNGKSVPFLNYFLITQNNLLCQHHLSSK